MPLLDNTVEEAFRLQQAVAQFSGIGLRRITHAPDRKMVAAFIKSLGESGTRVHNKARFVYFAPDSYAFFFFSFVCRFSHFAHLFLGQKRPPMVPQQRGARSGAD